MRASAAPMETPAPARRSAAPDPKKPRLAQPPPRDPRSYAAASNGASQAAAAAAELAMADELLAQYRTALGELTFNSKPIITNLTIIAGENLQAAKPIAGLICANILEVPSDQKLPSLYLLDSIVKNIGKDYVKHFSARLPEVFCKAYKQVDPSVHHSMRHLFGTWKGVFPVAPLQMIEKELGFQSSANGSSGGASSRPDSQSQRPSNSIHVNPKYLEARQQLNQPTKGLLGSGGKAPLTADAGDDIERANRISADRNAGRRLEALNARPGIQRTQRDPFSNPIHEKQAGRDVRGLGFSNTPRQAVVGAGQVRSKAKGQDGIVGPYHTTGVGPSEQRLDRRSNLYANKDVRPAVRLDGALLPTPSISSDIIGRASSNKSWKLSEEEEYVWDDVHSQVADYGSTNTVRKGEWMADDGNAKFTNLHRPKWTEVGAVEHLDSHNLPRFGHAAVQDRRIPAYMDQEEYLHGKHEVESRIDREMRPDGQIFPPPRGSSTWMSQEKTIPDVGLDPRVSRFSNQPGGPYSGRSSQDVTSVSTRSTETFGQQKQRYWSSSPPPAHSPSSAAPFARQRSPSPAETDFYPSRSFSQLGQNPQEEYRDQRALPQLAKDSHVLDQNALPTISPDLTSASNLLAGLLKSGFKPNNTSDLASLRAQPLVPTGSSPNTLTSLAADPSLQSPAIENTTLQAQGPNISRPPLPPGLPQPPSVVSSTQLVDKAAPLSSLLSSLVKKGLISSPATNSSVAVSSQQSKPSSMNTTDIITSASLPVIKPSVGKETSTPDSSAPKIVEIKTADLIGLEFKPEKLRKYNEHVISSLFDEQSHQCKTCGERFRLEEELRLHTTCRGSRESENIYAGIAPKRWYPNKSSYIDGSLEMENSTEVSDADLGSAEEVCEFMVPADESQIICALCGDPFDDIYSIERGDWMFKDAVFLDYPKGEDSCRNNAEKENERVPIVHARCMPRSSNDGMEVD